MKKPTNLRNAQDIGQNILLAASFFAFLVMFPYQASAAAITRQLDLGMTNADVTTLQTFLASYGTVYPEGLITGYFGTLTSAAVSRYQAANDLAQVGRVGPLTVMSINQKMGSGGTGGSTDDSAPFMYGITVFTTTNSATMSWTTSEATSNRVMYGSTWPFLYATAASVTSNTIGAVSSITIPNLQSRTTYYYVLESIDIAGNVTLTVGAPFTTQ